MGEITEVLWGEITEVLREKLPRSYYIIIKRNFQNKKEAIRTKGLKEKAPCFVLPNPEKRERVPLALHPFQDYGVSLFHNPQEKEAPLWCVYYSSPPSPPLQRQRRIKPCNGVSPPSMIRCTTQGEKVS